MGVENTLTHAISVTLPMNNAWQSKILNLQVTCECNVEIILVTELLINADVSEAYL